MRNIKRRSDCRISYALDIFGDKWTLLILRDLMLRGKSSYGEFLASEEKIATNILADRLEVLEHTGIIKKSRDPQNKTKYRYRLTQKGLDLLPVLIEMIIWSAKHAPELGMPKDPFMRNLALRLRKDKSALMQDIIKAVEKNQLELE